MQMRYLTRTTLGELTGLNNSPEIRRKAEELLALLREGRTSEPIYPDVLYDDVSVKVEVRPPI